LGYRRRLAVLDKAMERAQKTSATRKWAGTGFGLCSGRELETAREKAPNVPGGMNTSACE